MDELKEPILSSSAQHEDTTSSDQDIGEHMPLLSEKTRSCWSWLAMRYGTTRKCVSSKAALLILTWSFVVGLWNGMALNPDIYIRVSTVVYALFGYGFAGFIFCFFPLAGFLADIKYGRYKTVVTSLVILATLIGLALIVGPTCISIILIYYSGVPMHVISINVVIAFAAFAGLLLIISYIGLVGFTANVLQFGMDQLHDSPGEDRTLFIHWYVWLYYTSSFIGQLAWNLAFQIPYNNGLNFIIGIVLLSLIPLLLVVVLIITLCLARCRKRWFLIEPGVLNPYELVHRVTKFAYQHKTPVHRSAFTYCEDEVPTGLNLGKEKYGGCFTTEQVEDVKAFYGILKVLFSFGIVFFLDFAANSVLPLFALHTAPYYCMDEIIYYNNYVGSLDPVFNKTLTELILINSGLLSPLLIVICIPVYLCLLRPFISHYIPGMLKRMGLGMFFLLLSLLATISMDTAAHVENENKSTLCLFTSLRPDLCDNLEPLSPPPPLLSQDSYLLILQLVLSALSNMLIYIAVFEFICSQSPHSMKGLLIGLLYAIKGFYQVIATLLVIPFAVHDSFHPSCEFYYYLMNIVIGVVALLAYVCVARRYRYRERDEPSRVRQYAEEYYSNPQQERYYDYSTEQ